MVPKKIWKVLLFLSFFFFFCVFLLSMFVFFCGVLNLIGVEGAPPQCSQQDENGSKKRETQSTPKENREGIYLFIFSFCELSSQDENGSKKREGITILKYIVLGIVSWIQGCFKI